MTYNIINEPEEAKRYEFVVAKPLDEEGTYLFIGMYRNGFEADSRARDCGAVIFHNVQIQGYQEPPKPKKYFKISRMVEDVFEANSADEAEQFFYENESCGCYDSDPVITEITKEEFDNYWT